MIIAKSSIKHNGVQFEKGQELPEMGQDKLNILISAGVVEEIKIKATPEVSKQESKADESKEKDIKSMNKTELIAKGKEMGFEFGEEMTKKEMVEKLTE